MTRKGSMTRITCQDRAYALLRAHAGRTISRPELYAMIWGDKAPRTAPDLLTMMIMRIRKALPPGHTITTAWNGGGYCLKITERRDRHPFDEIQPEPKKPKPRGRKLNDLYLLRAEREEDARLRPPPKERKCLACRTPFMSTGPGNWLCDVGDCRARRASGWPDDYPVRVWA